MKQVDCLLKMRYDWQCCRSSPKPRMMVCGSPSSQSQTPSMVIAPVPTTGTDPDPELHTFREALSGVLFYLILFLSNLYSNIYLY